MDDVRVIVKGDTYTVVTRSQDEQSRFTLGTGGPHTILIKHHDNPLASQGFYGGTLTGTYELSGNTLRICYDLTGKRYPTGFEAPKGSRQVVYEFTREK